MYFEFVSFLFTTFFYYHTTNKLKLNIHSLEDRVYLLEYQVENMREEIRQLYNDNFIRVPPRQTIFEP